MYTWVQETRKGTDKENFQDEAIPMLEFRKTQMKRTDSEEGTIRTLQGALTPEVLGTRSEQESVRVRREVSLALYLERLRSGCFRNALWQEVVDSDMDSQLLCERAQHCPFVREALPGRARHSQSQGGGGGLGGQGSETGYVACGVLSTRGSAGTLPVETDRIGKDKMRAYGRDVKPCLFSKTHVKHVTDFSTSMRTFQFVQTFSIVFRTFSSSSIFRTFFTPSTFFSICVVISMCGAGRTHKRWDESGTSGDRNDHSF